jgi:hypothetical protein
VTSLASLPPRIVDAGIICGATPVVILIAAPAFATTLGAVVALIDCFVIRSYLHDNPSLWWWQCREMVVQDLREAAWLGMAYGASFSTFVVARTRMRATVELAMRCFGCGLAAVTIGIAAGAPIGWLLGQFAPWLWGWVLPAAPPGVDVPIFGALNGTGCSGYVGAAAALVLSCFLLDRRWRAMQIVSSRGFAVLPAMAPVAQAHLVGSAV